MSVEICKYDRDIDNYYKELLMNEVVCSQRIYEEYLKPATIELKIHYFQVNGEIRKSNLCAVMRELELLIGWAENHVEGEDLEYIKSKLQFMQELIPEQLQEENDVLYIL